MTELDDPGLNLQAAYMVALANLTTAAGVVVPLYASLAPDKAVAPYVIFNRGETRSAGTKTSFGFRLPITLDVVTRFGAGPVSDGPADAIVSAILARLFPAPRQYTVAPVGYALWACSYQGTKPITDRTNSGTLVRRIITIDHQLHPA